MALGHIGGRLDLAADHASHCQTAHVVVVVQRCHQKLQWFLGVKARGGNGIQNSLQKRRQHLVFTVRLQAAGTPAGVGVEDREFQLLLVGIQVNVEVIDLVEDFLDPGIGPIDLVDHDHGGQFQFKGLA